MNASRPGLAAITPATADLHASEHVVVERRRLVAVAGLLQCGGHLVLRHRTADRFRHRSGAWIANLTALASYKPLSMAGTAGLLDYYFYLGLLEARRVGVEEAGARPLTAGVVKF